MEDIHRWISEHADELAAALEISPRSAAGAS
jgi:hypothetical protein